MATVFQSSVVCAVALSALCCTSYWNSLSGELVHDDIFAIRDNADVRLETPLFALLSNDFWGKAMSDPTSHKSYRPLTVLTFRLNYLLHGLDPWGYHAVNVFLHALCTVLFWLLCGCLVFRNDVVGGESTPLSLQAAAVFAVHPIHTEAVAGVVGRADILACIFFECSLLSYYKCTRCVSNWSILYLTVSVLLGAAAMLSKEHGITVFGVCLLYELYLLYSQDMIKSVCVDWRKYQIHLPSLLRMAVLCIATLSLIIFRVITLHGHLPHFSSQDNPASFADSLTTRVLTYSYLYYYNAKLLVAPITLSYDWQMGSIPLVATLGDVRNFGTIVFFVYFVLLCWVILANFPKRDQYLTFCGMCLLVIPFLPASNIFLRVGFVLAERIIYMPSMGYCILLVHGFKQLCKVVHSRPILCKVVSVSLLLIIALYASKTVLRNRVWQNRETLFRSGVETLGHNAKTHYNYGNFLKDVGRRQEAIKHYMSAVSLASDHASSHNNLGTLLSGKEAEHHFLEAIKHNPRHSRAFYNLGNNLRDQGRHKEAETAMRNCLRIDPNYTEAIMSLANILSLQGNSEKSTEALEWLRSAAKLKPDDSDILNNYASLLSSLGHFDESASVYHQALKIAPSHATALAGLARVKRKLGENEQAERLYKRSLLLKDEASTYYSLGALYYNTGRVQEASEMFDKAVKLDPSRADYICSYSQSLSYLGNSKQAIVVLNQAVERQIPCIHLNLASNYAKQGLLNEALKHSMAAIKYSTEKKDLAEAYHLQGTLFKDLNQLSEAVESFTMATKISPSTTSFMNLGAVLHLMGNYSSAEHYYLRALEIDPSNVILKENLQKLSRIQSRAQTHEN